MRRRGCSIVGCLYIVTDRSPGSVFFGVVHGACEGCHVAEAHCPFCPIAKKQVEDAMRENKLVITGNLSILYPHRLRIRTATDRLFFIVLVIIIVSPS